MKTFTIYITATDETEVDAETEEEALELAQTVFEESGWQGVPNADIEIAGVREYDDEN